MIKAKTNHAEPRSIAIMAEYPSVVEQAAATQPPHAEQTTAKNMTAIPNLVKAQAPVVHQPHSDAARAPPVPAVAPTANLSQIPVVLAYAKPWVVKQTTPTYSANAHQTCATRIQTFHVEERHSAKGTATIQAADA